MSALVRLTLEETAESSGGYAFAVPAAAVFAVEDGTQNVWVVDEGSMTVERRVVEVGEVTGRASIRILAGLDPGDRIVTAAVTRLREGMQVSLWEE
jgi:multidrug efflux pump subunit AcrA (membrane-fusion protein)